jgi:lipopolysaccharide export system protein LptA
VRLSKDAWLSDGQREVSAPLLVYNIRAQRVEAASEPGTDKRVHITIPPESAKPQTTKPPAESTQPPPKPPP